MALTQAPEEGLKISNAPGNGKFLQYKDSTDKLTWADVDLTTKLNKAGDTITGDYTIASGVTNKNIDIDINNASTLIRFDDDLRATFGDDDDLQVLHDGTSGQIKSIGGKITVSTTANNDDIELTPHGTGDVVIDGLKYPQADGSAGQFLKTDGSAQLSWATVSSSPVTALNNATANEIVTVGATTTELDAEANLTFDGEQLNITHAGTTDPENQIVLQTSAVDAGGGSGIFLKSSSSTTANRYGSRIHTVREANGASQLVFSTELTGGTTGLQEALKISPDKNVTVSDGDLVIGTSGHGINFSITADSAATGATDTSELFSDYEEGTWTPVLNSGTCTPAMAYYVRCGNMVWVTASIGNISDRTSDSEVRVTTASLPFNTNISYNNIGPCRHRYTSHANVTLTAIIDGNGIYFGSSDEAFGDGAYHQLHYDEIDATYSEIAFAGWFRCGA